MDKVPTITDVINEMKQQHEAFANKVQPDMRALAAMLDDLVIDDVCEDTGATPLLWAIEHDSPLFNFCLARGADPRKRGEREYAIEPIQLALSKGLMEKAKMLARHGVPCPPELAVVWEEERRKRVQYDAEIKNIEKRLEKLLKQDAFAAVRADFETRLGVAAKKVRGRRGHVSFRNIPVRKLSKEEGLDEDSWMTALQRDGLDVGVSLFSTTPPGYAAKQEICLAPTVVGREIIAISSLLTREGGLGYERMEKADWLDGLCKDYNFHIVSCGAMGVFCALEQSPANAASLARRLLEACPELSMEYYSAPELEKTGSGHDFQDKTDDTITLIAEDIARSQSFFLPWGVDY